jgi:hypothetical protein
LAVSGVARLTVALPVVLVFLFLVAGSSATGAGARVAIRPPAAAAPGVDSQVAVPSRRSLPRQDLDDEKVLAWILLLMREGRGAR